MFDSAEFDATQFDATQFDDADSQQPDTDTGSGADTADTTVLTGDLKDPIAGVVAVELSRRFIQHCMCAAEPVVADLLCQEPMLRRPGGMDLAEHRIAQRLYHRFDPQVFGMLRVCVPLTYARFAFSGMEEMLRAQFGDVIKTAASYVLSDGRDTALHMMTVATTMAAREVRAATATIIADSHLTEEDH